ncbi:TetR family transcriptional regulator [Orrella marina]|uniref:TetR family transcriptional regulator n=1 Tax=Orrella marina TaxID=2163011 RepID=A0A2R4XNE0_9BURK|nr:TetR family transcriptional regulator [Orrella marina]AWB35305.1 TetR family transcriptional regulator [Orrella marina]
MGRTASTVNNPSSSASEKVSTRDRILQAAVDVFAKYGLAGGSVDKISKAANSHDRMIYYYFGNKEGLFVAVLEEIYRRFNVAECQIEIIPDDPLASLKRMIHFIIHYFRDHPEFVTILNSENLQRGKHVSKARSTQRYSIIAVGAIDTVIRQGQQQGLFRPEIRARDVYLMISSLGYFYQSNRFTLSEFLGERLEADSAFAQWEDFVTDAVLRTVLKKET